MVAAVGVQASQARTLVVELASNNLQLSQARTLAIYNFPTASVEASQAKTLTVGKYGGTEVQVSQTRTLAVVRGRTENRTLRMWTFSLDGHDFVVIRLGEISTIVFDMLTKKWFDWDTEDLGFWRANWRDRRWPQSSWRVDRWHAWFHLWRQPTGRACGLGNHPHHGKRRPDGQRCTHGPIPRRRLQARVCQ